MFGKLSSGRYGTVLVEWVRELKHLYQVLLVFAIFNGLLFTLGGLYFRESLIILMGIGWLTVGPWGVKFASDRESSPDVDLDY